MWKPGLDWIFIKRKVRKLTEGNIALPESVAENMDQRAEVVAVGPGRYSEDTCQLIPMPDVKPGDDILVHCLLNTGVVPVESKDLMAIKPRDILAVEAK